MTEADRIRVATARVYSILQATDAARARAGYDDARATFRDAIRAILDDHPPDERLGPFELALQAFDAELAEATRGGT